MNTETINERENLMVHNNWQDKANRIIAQECKRSYEQKNRLKNGQLRKKHVPYPVPELAEELIECLGQNDEERAKAIFINLAHQGRA